MTPEEMIEQDQRWIRSQMLKALFSDIPCEPDTRRHRASRLIWRRIGYRNKHRWDNAVERVQDKCWMLIEWVQDRIGSKA